MIMKLRVEMHDEGDEAIAIIYQGGRKQCRTSGDFVGVKNYLNSIAVGIEEIIYKTKNDERFREIEELASKAGIKLVR